MDRREVEDKALAYFESGFHCAESVAKAVMEAWGGRVSPDVPQIATAFGGGLGRTHEELCGALSGGVIMLGLALGRSQPGVSWQAAAESAAELRRRFLAEQGTTNCAKLLESFGEQADMIKCKRLTAWTAGQVAEILAERAGRKE